MAASYSSTEGGSRSANRHIRRAPYSGAVRARGGDLAAALRGVGGVLLALGAVVVVFRRSGPGRWTDFELMLTTAAPAVALFAISVAGRGRIAGLAREPWRPLLLVSAILLSPLALFLFLRWVGASSHHLLYDAGVLVVTAAIAVAGGRRAGSPYAFFLAGVALLGAWMLVWLKIFPDASGDTVRWLLLAGGAVLLAAAGAMAVLDAAGASEIATAGGLGLVAAGLVGVLLSTFGVFVSTLVGGGSSSSSSSGPGGSVASGPGEIGRHSGVLHLAGTQTTGWDIYLLVASLAFLWLAVRARARGPGYVGVLGALVFLISVGAQLTRLQAGRGESHSLLGWPVILVGLGLLGLLAPLSSRRRL
jgi:hypothetical protein